jgi:hypothetical protein
MPESTKLPAPATAVPAKPAAAPPRRKERPKHTRGDIHFEVDRDFGGVVRPFASCGRLDAKSRTRDPNKVTCWRCLRRPSDS